MAYAPEEGQHGPWVIEVCFEQFDGLVQELIGLSFMPLLQ